MPIFYLGVLVLIVIGAIELNPKRFKGTAAYKESDKQSGPILTITSVLVSIVSIVDKIFNLAIFQQDFVMIGLLMVILGFIIRSLAIRTLGNNFVYAVSPVKELHKEGIYKHLRHPAYLGTILYAIGTALFFSSVLGLATSLLVILSVIYRITVEEDFLEKTLGEDYKVYEKKTWRIVPFIY